MATWPHLCQLAYVDASRFQVASQRIGRVFAGFEGRAAGSRPLPARNSFRDVGSGQCLFALCQCGFGFGLGGIGHPIDDAAIGAAERFHHHLGFSQVFAEFLGRVADSCLDDVQLHAKAFRLGAKLIRLGQVARHHCRATLLEQFGILFFRVACLPGGGASDEPHWPVTGDNNCCRRGAERPCERRSNPVQFLARFQSLSPSLEASFGHRRCDGVNPTHAA